MATPDQLLDFNQAPETGHLHHPVPGRSGFPPVSSFHRQQFASTTGGSNIDDSNDVFYGMRNMPLSTASQSPGIDGLMERREVAVAAVEPMTLARSPSVNPSSSKLTMPLLQPHVASNADLCNNNANHPTFYPSTLAVVAQSSSPGPMTDGYQRTIAEMYRSTNDRQLLQCSRAAAMSIGRAAAVATPSGLFPLIQQQQRRKIEQYNNLRLTKLEALHLLSQQYQQMASNDRNALVWNSGRDLSYGTGFDNTSSSWPLAQGSPSEALVRSADQVDSQIVVGDPFKEFLVKKVGSGGEPGRRLIFPVPLAHPLDKTVLSSHQAFLREQIELFQATHEDIATPTRGRNKRIILGQVGMRCRHCAHVPVAMRQLGSTYFPSVMIGFYQAAQNMCSMHLQCGKCTSTPASVKQEFVNLLNTKNASSIAGRSYWAKTVGDLGLVDTEEGVFVKGEVPAHIKLIEKDSKNTHFYKSHTKKEQLSLSNKAS